MKACIVVPPSGSGRRNLKPGEDLKKFILEKKGIVTVKNIRNHFCLPLALVIGLELKFNPSFVSKIGHKRYPNSNWDILLHKAEDLCVESDIDVEREFGMGIEDLVKFQATLDRKFRSSIFPKRVRIVVFSDLEASVLWEGFEASDNIEQINLLLLENHFYVIKSTTATFSCSYFCNTCNRRYSRRIEHNCVYRCTSCTSSPICDKNVQEICCSSCNRKFFGQKCFQNHISLKICEKIRYCQLCGKTVLGFKKNDIHICGYNYCSLCQETRHSDHQCYIPKYKPKTLKNRVFVFFDLECTQELERGLSGPEHITNLCITQIVCEKCLQYNEKTYSCSNCVQRENIFPETCFRNCNGDCVLYKLFAYIFELLQKGLNVILVGHNMGLYDGHILLQYIFRNIKIFHAKPEIIVNGTKIYSINIGDNLKIIDSLNFFGVALSKLPQMFGFSGYKGFFPHLFNSNNHWDYIGKIPDKKYFMFECMKPAEKELFEEWWNEQTNSDRDWIFCEEIVKYCSNDVSILRRACVQFYNYFLQNFSFDVYANSITIASACNKIFRFKFMKNNQIGIIPNNGYRMRENQSYVALQWLYLEEQRRGISIQHCGNGVEKKIGVYRVDGYYKDPITHLEIIFEFLGCYYHGCPKCFNSLTQNDERTLKAIQRRESTFKRLEYLRNYFQVEIIWECDFYSLINNNASFQLIVSSTPYTEVPPLNPREAFYGGRTNVIKYYYKAEENEEIKYFDVCSLYPYINKTYKVPLGHPKVKIGLEANNLKDNLSGFEGLIKCKVLPPRDLYHPVLPYKMHKKLMFFLCFKCASEFIQTCSHCDDDRAFVGTWVSDEVKLAVAKGYKILKVYEAWEYSVKTGVFAEYVNTFLKDKQEASGFPDWVNTEEDKNSFINQFYRKEDVLLDYNNIVKNPPKRATSKLILNSFWGKFGENANLKSSVKLVDDPLEFFRLVTDSDIDVTKIIVINQDSLLVCYKDIPELRAPLNTVNVAVAAYTTAGARLQLYKYLDFLQKRVIYFDTDSVIFSQKSDEPTLPLGDFLGDLTDELQEYGRGAFINEFVSGGPKNYAYCVRVPNSSLLHYKCKVKGFTLNSKNSEKINFSSIKEMVLKFMKAPHPNDDDELDENDNYIITEEKKIRRHGIGRIYTKTETKLYKITSGKRKISNEFDTFPWGYHIN